MNDKKTSYLEAMAIKQQMSVNDFDAEGKSPIICLYFTNLFLKLNR